MTACSPASHRHSRLKTLRSLERLGVTPLLHYSVVDLDDYSVTATGPDGQSEQIAARTVIWAAGVIAAPLAGILARSAGLEPDRSGRVEVLEDLSLPGHREILAIGDMVRVRDGGRVDGLPGRRAGRDAAGTTRRPRHRRAVAGREPPPFHYRDKGNLATIGRARAVAEVGQLHLSGFIAWVTWLVVHLWYLIGFENRLLVMIRWALSFLTHGRGVRLITRQPTERPSA